MFDWRGRDTKRITSLEGRNYIVFINEKDIEVF